MRLSFIGDIMCELPLQKALKTESQYEALFSEMCVTFSISDYVVGNLETVFAGEDKGYTNDLFSFNTKDSFARSIKKCGIDLVSTANNHCLDRGIKGLLRTIEILNENGLEHIGTYKDKDEKHFLVKQFGDIKIAFLSYTYGTNIEVNQIELKESERFHVDLLEPHKKNNQERRGLKRALKYISAKRKLEIKKILGLSYKNIAEDRKEEQIDRSYLSCIAENIKEARAEADYVIVLLHSGGQFNDYPGSYTEFMMDFFKENGVDAVIGNHPHVVQKYSAGTGMISVYSLGNFSISPSSIYVPVGRGAEYSILFHLYFDEKTKKVLKKSFQILKLIEEKNGLLKVYPVSDLYRELNNEAEKIKLEQDCRYITKRFLGEQWLFKKIETEYFIN